MAILQIQFRRDTYNNWSGSNPILAQGEPAYDTDSGTFKIGDGTTEYLSLPNALAGTVLTDITASGIFTGDGSGLTGVGTADLPTGTVSGSSQLTSSYDTRYELSGSAVALPDGVVSGSSQLDGTTINSLSGSFSGSFQGDGSNLTGVGGTEYQIYERVIGIDSTVPNNWVASPNAGFSYYDEWNSSTNINADNSLTTILGGTLRTNSPVGVADGAQTVEYIKLWCGSSSADQITKISIIKYKNTGNTIDSIAVLYDGATVFTPGSHITILAAAFTETAISDQDKIGVFFKSDTTSDVSPLSFRLKCSID